MGAYLSEPNLKKESIDDESGQLSYGASSMQGWRLEQEDAHNAILNFDLLTNTSFFAVYDGHGGAEVAQYCAKYLPDYLKNLDEYKKGNLEEALKALFLKFDESLLSAEAEKELKDLQEKCSGENSIQQDPNEEDTNEEDDDESEGANDQETEKTDKKNAKKTDDEKEYVHEIDALYDEACMPIEEVLKRYENAQIKTKKSLLKKNGLKPGMSPMITAPGSSKNAKRNQSDLAAQIAAAAASDEPPKSAQDFNKQEELDIKEIKKNGNNDDINENGNGTSNHAEHEFDEASNLCDLTDSQKSTASLDVTTANKSTTDMNKTTESESASAATSNGNTTTKTPKLKMSKEELKLSPIHMKSLSSSSLTGDNNDALSTTTTEANVNNNNNEAADSASEENKENQTTTDQQSAAQPAEATNEVAVNGQKKATVSRSNLIAKILAGCINKKLKESRKPAKKTDTQNDQEPDEEEEDEDEDFDAEEDSEENSDASDDDEDFGEEDDDEEDDDDDDDEEASDEEVDEEEKYPSNGSRPGYDSGCTAVVAVLRENKYLYVANAGDSRCVVCRDGKAIEMSFDHKPEDDLERERVEKAGGQVTKDGRINNGLNLSRAIGDHSYKANKELPLSEQMITSLPDIQKLEIDSAKDSFMVLACDGIWNFMSSQDVCDYIQERLNANYSKLSQICEELFMHCLAPNSDGDGTGCDNMTCILVTFKPFRKVEFKFNKSALQSSANLCTDNEKNSLKRSHELGNDEDSEKLTNGSAVIAKKLKQDEQDTKQVI